MLVQRFHLPGRNLEKSFRSAFGVLSPSPGGPDRKVTQCHHEFFMTNFSSLATPFYPLGLISFISFRSLPNDRWMVPKLAS